MTERYETVKEVLGASSYLRKNMVGRLVRDPKTREEYEVCHLTKRDVRCAEMKGGSIIRFDSKYFGSFEVLSIEMHPESR